MKYKTILLSFSIFLTCLTICSCKKDKVITSDDEKFCEFVNSKDYEATRILIDKFLTSLDKGKKEANLYKLVDWMNAKSCVDTTWIGCISCIYTGPAISELGVTFISNGQDSSMTMDIIMSDPLKCGGYH